ncbi:MAG: hypothetical protein WC043_00155 [Pseudobdellovibrionaceae bacterium]
MTITLITPALAHADDLSVALHESLRLMEAATSPDEYAFIKSVPVIRINGKGSGAPLARYVTDKGGRIEISDKTDLARKDFSYLSTIQERSQRPSFDQYLTVLTFLNLANELAHALQHRNRSLDDFYTLYNEGNINEACTLYGLQQHVSDIAMLEKAVRLERYFLGQGQESGIRALHLALERNNLIGEYEIFRQSITARDIAKLNYIKNQIRIKREWQNMKGLNSCKSYEASDLAPDVTERATQPVEFFSDFMQQQGSAHHKQSRTDFYPAGRD